MGLGIAILDTIMGYVSQGLELIRSILNKVAALSPFDPTLSVTVIFLLASIWFGHFITKKFVTQPFSIGYLPWTLIISLLIFLNLLYL